MPPSPVRGLREFDVPAGRLVQGGADAVRSFYKESGAVVVNCARRTGDASVEARGEVEIYWLPMTESNMQEACSRYLDRYGQTLLAAWINCEGKVDQCPHVALPQQRMRCTVAKPWRYTVAGLQFLL